MPDIFELLKAIRPPTTSFVNDESFPEALRSCPALNAVASGGFRDKEIDEGFMSGMSIIYDTLEGTPHAKVLTTLTLDDVGEIDQRIQSDPAFLKDLLEKAPYLSRYLKTKASAGFKAGVMLAIASACYGSEIAASPTADDQSPDIDTTPVARTPSLQESEIRDETQELPPTKLGPLSQLLYTLQKALPAIREVSVEAVMDAPMPSATLHITIGPRTPFDQLVTAVTALKEAGIKDVQIGNHEGSVTIDLIV